MHRRSMPALALLLFLVPQIAAHARSSFAHAEAAAPLPAVPAGTRMALLLDERLDSGLVHAGQRFALHVAEDVQVEGAVVVPKGAVARGTVLFARAKGSARSGALDLRVDPVESPAGPLRVRVNLSRRSRYLAAEHAADHALRGLGFVVETEQGEDIVLDPGTIVEAEVVDEAAPPAIAMPDWLPARKPDQGLVIIFREKRFYGSANSMSVFADDGIALPKVKNGRWVHHYFPPGDHRLYRDKKQRDVRIVGVEPGSVQFFEARFEAKSTIGADVDLVPVEPGDAIRRISATQSPAR
jgi:hypothetical protein